MYTTGSVTGLEDETVYYRLEPSYLDNEFSSVFSQYAGYQMVVMPPTWKEPNPSVYTFVLFDKELSPDDLKQFFDISLRNGVPNPRPVSSRLLELASLFHPSFYLSFTHGRGRLKASEKLDTFLPQLQGCRLLRLPESSLPVASARYYLQSQLFLSGCTLTAAIVQNRYTEGTIDSKLNRLWQAAQYAKRYRFSSLEELSLDEFVIDCAASCDMPPHQRLIKIKKKYSEALKAISDGLSASYFTVCCDELFDEEKLRFGFVSQIRNMLGSNLESIFVYGSAVTSSNFSDYDLVVVVKDSEEALKNLAGTSPRYKGKEINMSIYNPEEFSAFQLMSGDNLNCNARCIYGKAEIVIKPSTDLIIRNFSFGFIRMRQLLGMAAFLARHGVHEDLDDQRNLYEYFIKIPMHIMKGILSVAGEPVAKEKINACIAKELGYDIREQIILIEKQACSEAISNAHLGTMKVMEDLNTRYKVFETVPRSLSDIWDNKKCIE